MKSLLSLACLGLMVFSCKKTIHTCSGDNTHPAGFTLQTAHQHLRDGWYEVVKTETGNKISRNSESYSLSRKPVISVKDIDGATYFERDEDAGIDLKLKEGKISSWHEVTTRSVGSYIVFILGDKIINVQKVGAEVPDGKMAVFAEKGVDLKCVKSALEK